MKKKYFGVVLAAAMMAQPLMVLAAENPSANANVVVRPSRDRSSSSSSKPLDTTATSGVGFINGETGTTTPGAVVPSTSIDNVTVRFASVEENKEKFSSKVVEIIDTINSGTTPLYRAIGTPEMVSYNPLIPLQTLVVEETATHVQKKDPVTVTLYLPNLIEGLNNVQILYYNEATKQWEFLAPSAVNYATKQITVTLNGDTPFTVVYQNK